MQTNNNIQTEFYIENKSLQCPTTDSIMEKKSEWDIIDDLVLKYQEQFNNEIEQTESLKSECDKAAAQLLEKFKPLFKKYVSLLKTGQINFDNVEQKLFVSLFIDDQKLRKALYSKNKLDRETKSKIFQKFNFIKETYGNCEEDEILTDLYVIFFVLAKRYKKMKRSFCCYIYNTIRYEMFRHIQIFTRNPANIHYRNYSYEEISNQGEIDIEPKFIPKYELDNDMTLDNQGLPSSLWIAGLSCSEAFSILTPLERKILSKYYIENYNDKQLSKEFKLHENTCNLKRHRAVEKIAKQLGIDPKEAKRIRNSGAHK